MASFQNSATKISKKSKLEHKEHLHEMCNSAPIPAVFNASLLGPLLVAIILKVFIIEVKEKGRNIWNITGSTEMKYWLVKLNTLALIN